MKEMDIQNPTETFSELAPEAREQLTMILGPIFQEGAANATSQRWAGIIKLADIRYRLSLYKEQKLSGHAQLTINAKLHSENLDKILEGVNRQIEVLEAKGFGHLGIDNDRYAEIMAKTVMYDYFLGTQDALGLSEPKLTEAVKELLPPQLSPEEDPKITKVEKVESEEFDEEFVEGDFSENGKGSIKRTKEKKHD
jgi:hypothetical protein